MDEERSYSIFFEKAHKDLRCIGCGCDIKRNHIFIKFLRGDSDTIEGICIRCAHFVKKKMEEMY